MRTRVISGIGIAVVLVTCVLLGATTFGLLLGICSLIAVNELSKAVGIHDSDKKCNILEAIMYISTIMIYLVTYLSDRASTDKNIMIVMIASILAILAVFVFAYPKYHTTKIACAIFIVFYAPLMLSFGYRVEAYSSHPIVMTALLFAVTCVSDVGAYFVGVNLGKHKLAPVLSPKKSIEGSVGAIIITTIVCALIGFVLGNNGIIGAGNTLIFAVIGALGSVISQIGDLAASAIKRNYDIKDYGKLIPGHGGIMDRVDSWIVVFPIIYFLIDWIK